MSFRMVSAAFNRHLAVAVRGRPLLGIRCEGNAQSMQTRYSPRPSVAESDPVPLANLLLKGIFCLQAHKFSQNRYALPPPAKWRIMDGCTHALTAVTPGDPEPPEPCVTMSHISGGEYHPKPAAWECLNVLPVSAGGGVEAAAAGCCHCEQWGQIFHPHPQN